MGTAQLQADILDVIVQITFWTSALFVPAVSTFWPWWRHPYARAAISIDVLLALLLLPAVIRDVFSVPTGDAAYGWFTITAFALVPVRTAWLGWTIWRLQREPPQRPERL